MTLIEVGMSRPAFAPRIAAKNGVQFGIGICAWWVVGFAFAYGEVNDKFLGHKYWAGDEWRHSSRGIMATVTGLFGISVIYIINGVIAERTQHLAYLLSTFIIMAFAWPVAVGWGWGGGWLAGMPVAFRDFGGTATIHVFAGAYAFVATLFLQKRVGRWNPTGQFPEFTYNNPAIAAIGTMLYFLHLLFLNSFQAPHVYARGMAIFNTWLGAGTCALVTTVLGTLFNKGTEYHFLMICRGFIGGAVLVSSCAWNVDAWASFTFAFVGGVIFVISVKMMDCMHIDDMTHGISTHLVMGLVGCFGVGLWDNEAGGFHDNDGALLGTQLAGELAIAAWAIIFAVGIFTICWKVKLMKLPEDLQRAGFHNLGSSLIKGMFLVGSLEEGAPLSEQRFAPQQHMGTDPGVEVHPTPAAAAAQEASAPEKSQWREPTPGDQAARPKGEGAEPSAWG